MILLHRRVGPSPRRSRSRSSARPSSDEKKDNKPHTAPGATFRAQKQGAVGIARRSAMPVFVDANKARLNGR